MPEPDRIATVSTVMDSPEYIERFVRRTLRSGVDHMILFLDAAQPGVREMLASHPNVTVVRTDAGYWQGDRPARVVDRQMVNANVAGAALAGIGSVRWLFHIDGDEALAFDREQLLAIDARAVRLRTLEAVARRRWPDHEPRWFKRVPAPGELHALAALGRIPEVDVDLLFRGHTLGKSGIRPATDLRFRVHTAYQLPDTAVEVVSPDMHVLHYESYTLEDFLHRWRHYVPSDADLRPFKDKTLGAAFHAVSNSPALDERARARRLARLFDRAVADDERLLRQLGLLVRNPLRDVRPRPLPPEDLRSVEQSLDSLLTCDKTPFRSVLLEGRKRARRTSP